MIQPGIFSRFSQPVHFSRLSPENLAILSRRLSGWIKQLDRVSPNIVYCREISVSCCCFNKGFSQHGKHETFFVYILWYQLVLQLCSFDRTSLEVHINVSLLELTLLMFCLLNPQTNACEPNRQLAVIFNRWKSVTKIFCFHAISTNICLLF